MSYRNKTYVIFDGDNDIWAYRFMKGWKVNDKIDFDFYDAHDLHAIRDDSSEDTVKRRLRDRFSNAKQAVVLVGDSTKNLYRFVRWEIELAKSLNLPITVVNLNEKRMMDPDRCPAVLRDHLAIHIAFKMKIIQHALDNWPTSYADHSAKGLSGPYYYKDDVYARLGVQ